MKIAMCYRGFYKRSDKITDQTPTRQSRDRVYGGNNFTETIQNHHQHVWSKLNHLDIYFHTYSADVISDSLLIDTITKQTGKAPVKHRFQQYTNQGNRRSLNSVTAMVKQGEQYDLVINTRWDLWFNVDVERLIEKIDHDRFNFMWREPGDKWDLGRMVCDLMFIYPGHMHEAWLRSLRVSEFDNADPCWTWGREHYKGFHTYYSALCQQIPEDQVHFMTEQRHDSLTGSADWCHIHRRYDQARVHR